MMKRKRDEDADTDEDEKEDYEEGHQDSVMSLSIDSLSSSSSSSSVLTSRKTLVVCSRQEELPKLLRQGCYDFVFCPSMTRLSIKARPTRELDAIFKALESPKKST